MATYDVTESFGDKFKKGYDDLLNRLDSANNFYEAIAMKEESDRLKLRYVEEINKEVEKQKPDKPNDPENSRN